MREKGCTFIFFDENNVAVRWEGIEAFDVLDFLFKDRLHSASNGALSYFILKAVEPQRFLLYQGQKLLCEGDPGKVAVILLSSVMYELAIEAKGGLLFHAAALSRNGRSILMPGQSGSGKTFLAASLADNGYSYLTDELTLVEPENYFLHGFSKPLHIKNPHVFNRQIASKASCTNPIDPGCGSMPVEKGFLTNCFHVNPLEKRPNTKAAIIIFPKYETGKEFDVRRLTCANTGLFLMQSLINATNLATHGFHEIAALSRNIPAYIMTYGDSSRAVQKVNSFLDF